MKIDPRQTALPDDGLHRRLVEAITDYAIYMTDAGGRVISWNAGAERITGYTDAEAIGAHFSRLYDTEQRRDGEPERELAAAREHGRGEAEGWRLRKDGGAFWANTITDVVRGEGGALVGYAWVTRDLTEQKTAREALRSSEEQFRILVQGVTDYAIYMLDTEGEVVSWNAGARRVKGYEASEILGQHFSRFYTPEDRRAGAPQTALRIAEREGRFEKEGRRVRKDGSEFWAHVVIDAIRDDDGVLVGFAKVTRDISERREAERALAQAQHALFQSQKLESIGQLTGGVAHDFNNLLTVITGSLDLLRKYLPPERKPQALLDNAMQGADRGAVLTQRMLAFARRQELRPQAVDVPVLVKGMRGLIDRSIDPSVRVEVRFPKSMPKALTDPNQLESALLNLVVNARDAMPKGGVIMVIAHGRRIGEDSITGLRPGRYVRLCVIDAGEGMEEQTLSRAMEPFFTTKGIGKGTGLGLSMVHGLAEQSGGKLMLTSRRGKGTRVEIWLPAARDGAEAERAGAAPAADQADARQLIILVVDDDSLVLTNTVALLEDQGHRVFEASSGAQALETIVRESGIDLVITDQAMPRMTGLELIAAARTYRPNLPVILATGYAELPAGADLAAPRLAKPFTQNELCQAVARVMALDP